jgi:conjugal transfer ATP-binding protein TraC
VLNQLLDALHAVTGKVAHLLGERTHEDAHTRRGAHQAQQALQVALPSLRQLLPYETVDEEGLFINKTSVGFCLHLLPATGADEALVKSMAALIKGSLPINVDCTVMLHKHPYIEEVFRQGFEPMRAKGGMYARLAEMSVTYHKTAVKNGYRNGQNLSLYPCDYRCYLFFSVKQGRDAQAVMRATRLRIESELTVANLTHARLMRRDFITLMRALVSPDASSINWPQVDDDASCLMSHLIPSGNSMIRVDDLSLDIDISDQTGAPHTTRIINCQIEKMPEAFALWQTPDFFANALKPANSIPCSFVISFSFRGVDPTVALEHAKKRAGSLNSNGNTVQQFLNPNMRDEASDWNYVYTEGSKDNVTVLPTFYNVMLFTSTEGERDAVAKAIGAYRQAGFHLSQTRGAQWAHYLASLPFFMTEGFFADLNVMGFIKPMTHHMIANLMPIVASHKGSSSGLLIPTHHNQVAFLDLFDDKTLPITNFNCLTVGSTGAGKSMFQQAQILSGRASGEMTYVIDIGESYKHLCKLLGGAYIDVSSMTLNPFTLFDFDGVAELNHSASGEREEAANCIQIRDLLAIMASPEQAVCDVQKTYLLDAACLVWKQKGRQACVDDVLTALAARSEKDTTQDTRLTDLVLLLDKYGKNGIYGSMFNGETPLIADASFVVFEMGGLASNPDLLKIVMFVMIVIIQGQFYQTDRRVKKRCIIDEAWRFITDGENPIAANFIAQGFRTARKYNAGFGVMTQYLCDTQGSLQGQAIEAASDTKIIMRQGNFEAYITENPTRFSAFEQEMIHGFAPVSGAGFSSLMINAGNTTRFHRYFADPFTRVLFSSKGTEFEAVNAKVSAGLSLEEAVFQVATDLFRSEM